MRIITTGAGLLAGFFILLGYAPLTAQLSEQDTARWQYLLSLNGTVLTGNVSRTLVLGTAELRHVTERWGAYSGNTYQFGTFGGRRTEDDLISRNFLYLFPKRRWYPYQMTWLERNLRRRIDFRYQVGIGATVVAVRQAQHLLKLSATGTYEETLFNGTAFTDFDNGGSDRIGTWRLTGRIFGWSRLGKDGLLLRYEYWIQPSLEERKNFRYHLEASLSLPLGRRLSLRTAVNYSHESIVLQGVRQDDLLWVFGLSFGNRN